MRMEERNSQQTRRKKHKQSGSSTYDDTPGTPLRRKIGFHSALDGRTPRSSNSQEKKKGRRIYQTEISLAQPISGGVASPVRCVICLYGMPSVTLDGRLNFPPPLFTIELSRYSKIDQAEFFPFRDSRIV